MLQSDEISYQTFWDLLSNNGWGRDNVTAAEEQREISRQPQIPTPPEEVIEVERDET